MIFLFCTAIQTSEEPLQDGVAETLEQPNGAKGKRGDVKLALELVEREVALEHPVLGEIVEVEKGALAQRPRRCVDEALVTQPALKICSHFHVFLSVESGSVLLAVEGRKERKESL